jgi:hypothetical protein
MSTRNGYLRIESKGTTITVAVALRRNGDNYEAAFAFCNSKDEFNKKIGRTIALGRLNSSKVVRFVSNTNAGQAMIEALRIAYREDAIPGRIAKLLQPSKQARIHVGLSDMVTWRDGRKMPHREEQF